MNQRKRIPKESWRERLKDRKKRESERAVSTRTEEGERKKKK